MNDEPDTYIGDDDEEDFGLAVPPPDPMQRKVMNRVRAAVMGSDVERIPFEPPKMTPPVKIEMKKELPWWKRLFTK